MVKTNWGRDLVSATGSKDLCLRDFSTAEMIDRLDTLLSLAKKSFNGSTLSWWKTLIEHSPLNFGYLSADDLEHFILEVGDRYFVEFNMVRDKTGLICLTINR